MHPAKGVCFTCLGKNSINDQMVDLNKLDLDGISFMRKLKNCVQELYYGEPKTICKECVERLRIAYNFRETVLLSQKSLQESLSNAEVVSNAGSVENENGELLIKSEDEEEKVGCDDILATLCKEIDIKTDTKKKTKSKGADSKQECEFCNLELPNKRLLRKHINEFHKPEKLFVCTYCNKEFKQAFHLREHIFSHTGEKKYSCNVCDKKFQRLSSRSRHMKSHDKAPGQKTKRTPFLCTICGKRFPFSNSVQRHMRVHLGIKMHQCAVCHKRFNQSTHLRVHMRTHTGEKPYICDLCGNAFSLNASLQKHLITHKTKDKQRAQFKFELAVV